MTIARLKRVNSDYLIKVTGKDFLKPVNKFVGLHGLYDLIGRDLSHKVIDKAYNNYRQTGNGVYTRVLRRGLTIKMIVQ